MEFWKMTGAGNDFVLVDNRALGASPDRLQKIARLVCRRRMSIGADGLMAVDSPLAGGDFRMLFFNADGSAGEMCGNGARCICRYGWERGLAGDIQRVETTAGLVTGWRLGRNTYRVRLNNPTVLDPARPTGGGICGYVELGSPGLPHALVQVSGLAQLSRQALLPRGRALRFDPAFPKGANVNFYEILGPDHVALRTYERGVEDFTEACGTGSGSLAALLTVQGRVTGREVRVENPGGTLLVDVEQDQGRVAGLYLTGPTDIVCKGEFPDELLPD